MSTPSKVTSPRRTRKTKSTTSSTKIVCSIIFNDSARRKTLERQKYKQEVDDFLEQLSDEHHDVVCDYLDLLWGRNEKSIAPHESSQVIPFPAGGKRGVQIAKEA